MSPGLARATIVYDSVHVASGALNTDWDWVDPSAQGALAASFSLAYTQTLNSVSVELSADTPNDGGSFMVVLMSDVTGSPSYATDPVSHFVSFTHDIVLATISDSMLNQTLGGGPALLTIHSPIVLSAGRYWIGIETPQLPSSVALGQPPATGTFGSAQWWWTTPNPGGAVGLAGQSNFNTLGGAGPFPVSGVTAFGAYELVVDTPEPATIAILGAGLAGLGYVRRRKAKQA